MQVTKQMGTNIPDPPVPCAVPENIQKWMSNAIILDFLFKERLDKHLLPGDTTISFNLMMFS
jgi:hypothetical protein